VGSERVSSPGKACPEFTRGGEWRVSRPSRAASNNRDAPAGAWLQRLRVFLAVAVSLCDTPIRKP
jgi:hypothetical protein